MDPIKEAFSKIKEDILQLKEENSKLRTKIGEILLNQSQQTDKPTHNQTTPTHNTSNTLHSTDKPTHNQPVPTHNQPVEPLYTPNIDSSIGNEGVPTDKPTDTQTNQQTPNYAQITPKTDFETANEILSNLDNIKKGIRLKFKRLTPQEMLVFSTLYTLEEQKMEEITYRTIAEKLRLSESSIRDYTNKLIKKGIPIDKLRQNNKTILLKVSSDLKNIATLATIQDLRQL